MASHRPRALPSTTINLSHFTHTDSIKHLWTTLNLPPSALPSLNLPEDPSSLPSSFKIGLLAQSSIALSALTASLFHSLRSPISSPISRVTVPPRHALAEFKSERLYTLNGKPMADPWGPIGGLHKAADGYVRIHDNFPNHLHGTLRLLDLPSTASRADVAARVAGWKAVDLETAAFENKVVIAALRSYQYVRVGASGVAHISLQLIRRGIPSHPNLGRFHEAPSSNGSFNHALTAALREWDTHPQALALPSTPITIQQLTCGPPGLPPHLQGQKDKCLRGLRVLELSRVIAAPVAGKTLAAHGADVLWITSPNLPDLPALDRDLSRGKRTLQLDLESAADCAKLRGLVRGADVFIQGYRPGSLRERGFGPEELVELKPDLIYASMSAYGSQGPWSHHRGFDSLVQTCTGMNTSEASHYSSSSSSSTNHPAQPTPCQALDHGSGYFLAAGILAALCRRVHEGGSWIVEVSLAGTGKWLRGLGQVEGRAGFESEDITREGLSEREEEEWFESRECGFGSLRAVRHSAGVERLRVGWEEMPKELGSDRAEWL